MYEEGRTITNQLTKTDKVQYVNETRYVSSAAKTKNGYFVTPLTRLYMVCLVYQAKLGHKLYALEYPLIEDQELTKRVDDKSSTWSYGNRGLMYKFGNYQLVFCNGRWYMSSEWNRIDMKRYDTIQKLMKNTRKAFDILQIFEIFITTGIRPLRLSGFNMIQRCTENIIDILTIVDNLLTIYSNIYGWFLW